MTSLWKVLAVGFLSFSTALNAEVDFSRIDLIPLLRVNASRRFTPNPSNVIPPPPGVSDDTILVTRGGGMIALKSDQGAASPFNSHLTRGVAKPAEQKKLRAALAAAQVGLQGDCALSGVVEAGEATGRYEVTWYGGARRNEFVVVFFSAKETPTLPLCPPQVSLLKATIEEYVFKVALDPESESLDSFGQ